jgi:hypothetical protein
MSPHYSAPLSSDSILHYALRRGIPPRGLNLKKQAEIEQCRRERTARGGGLSPCSARYYQPRDHPVYTGCIAVPPRRALFLNGGPVTSTDLYEQSRPISAAKSDYAPLRPLVNWIRKINYQENGRAVGLGIRRIRGSRRGGEG